MDLKTFEAAMGMISDGYYAEAAGYRKKRRKNMILKLCAAACAACLALVSPAAFESGETESEAFSISLDSVSFNSIEGIVSLDYARYDPLEDTELLWDMGSIMDYYGKDAFPSYISEGLVMQNGQAYVYQKPDGGMSEDTVTVRWQLDEKEMSVEKSSLGIVKDCIYLLPESETQTTYIGKTGVLFGRNENGVCTAEFESGGIDYLMVARGLEPLELVKTAASVILKTDEIKIE